MHPLGSSSGRGARECAANAGVAPPEGSRWLSGCIAQRRSVALAASVGSRRIRQAGASFPVRGFSSGAQSSSIEPALLPITSPHGRFRAQQPVIASSVLYPVNEAAFGSRARETCSSVCGDGLWYRSVCKYRAALHARRGFDSHCCQRVRLDPWKAQVYPGLLRASERSVFCP